MKVKTVYQCEKCGEEYLEENDCLECEKNHILPVKISARRLHYRSPREAANHVYPTKIFVEMENGDVVTYHFERSLNQHQESQ